MITNERQYRITKAQLERFKSAIDSFDIKAISKKNKSKILARAELDALKSEYEKLMAQIQGYETLRSGTIEVLTASNLEELPAILIKARIVKGFSQRQLAESISLKEQQIQRYEAEKYASANLQRLAEVANALDFNISEIGEFRATPQEITGEQIESFTWDEFPVKEMYLRNWFEGYSGSLQSAIDNSEELVKDFVEKSLHQPIRAAARQRVRSGGLINRYALIAWQCRVTNLAKKVDIPNKFKQSTITDEWLGKLAQLSSDTNGPQKAVEYLLHYGIRLVTVSHLSQTHLDGAAFLLPDSSPVIGLTLRYDRLDNFWFVLFHELIHIVKHLHKGNIESIFDDLDAKADDIELEADAYAAEILVPSDKWETALVRYTRSEDSIRDFADELGVSSAIVAGKIRKEADNYTILTNMVGHGEVRKLFPDFDFS